MLNIFLGTVLGYLAGIGIGGGSLLMLWLTMIVGMTQMEARSINLLFFLASAGAVSIIRFRKGKIQFKMILPAIITGCVSAGICSLLSAKLDPQLLKKGFGVLLLFTGFNELRYREK